MRSLVTNVPTLAALLCALAGCTTVPPEEGGSACVGGKCDDPEETSERDCKAMCGEDQDCFDQCRKELAERHCAARRSDAMESGHKSFTPDAIRWACADVEGVNTVGNDDRGQEYCEYFAIVQPPPATEGGALPAPVDLGRNLTGEKTTPLALELTEDQRFALEDEPDAVAGVCLFTSWHQDVRGPLKSCGGGCPEITIRDDARLPSWTTARGLGFKLSAEIVRMVNDVNSNSAAADLVEQCLAGADPGDPAKPNDPLHEPYWRGCMHAFELFGTEWRRSDPTICAASTRLTECGCGVDTDGDGDADITGSDVATALVPRQDDGPVTLRGFPLGTWSSQGELPAGCRWLDTGDASHVIVACDLTASDVLAAPGDLKGRCGQKYGDNVVVHVPIPAAAIVCDPPAGGQYAGSCGAHPWVVGDEG